MLWWNSFFHQKMLIQLKLGRNMPCSLGPQAAYLSEVPGFWFLGSLDSTAPQPAIAPDLSNWWAGRLASSLGYLTHGLAGSSCYLLGGGLETSWVGRQGASPNFFGKFCFGSSEIEFFKDVCSLKNLLFPTFCSYSAWNIFWKCRFSMQWKCQVLHSSTDELCEVVEN